MPVTKVPLTKTDIESLKNKKKTNSNVRIMISFLFLFILFVVYLFTGFDTSNSVFIFFGILAIAVHSFLFLGLLIDTNFDNDLIEKQKYIGVVKVKKKEYLYDNEDGFERFTIDFDEWRIGSKSLHEEYWKKINEGDEFYVEQATNSGLLLKLEKENEDFINGIVR